MLATKLHDLAQAIGGRLVDADPAAPVSGPIAIDSRVVEVGGVFAALSGEHADGHDYASAAVTAGAAVVLAARPVEGVPCVVVDDVAAAMGRLGRHLTERLDATIIGITGSAGKTSTKDFTLQILREYGATIATEGSRNNELGLPMTISRADARTRFLVLEMGARGIGHVAYLTSIAQPHIAAVTNVGSAHAGEFGGRAVTAQAKGELVEALDASGTAVLNRDDELVAGMAARSSGTVLWFGRDSRADVTASNVRLDEYGRARFRLHTPDGSASAELGLYGEHQVANALAAAGIAYATGMETGAIAAGLVGARALSPGRMELHERDDGITIINDAFNANPDSVRAALGTVAAMRTATGRRTIAVLGEMAELGEDGPAGHQEVGRMAARSGVGLLVAVGGQDAALIADAALAEIPGLTVRHVPDRKAAEEVLTQQLRPGDIVVVKASHAIELHVLAERLIASDTAP